VCAARAAQRWGWHQLDPSWARQLVSESGTRAGDLVLDVGAGTGAITERLLAVGARVVAVELHGGRAGMLRARFAGRPVRVVRADASDLRLPCRPFRVVANPPFAIATSLLRRLLAPGSRLLAADLVLPEHVVRRWADGRAPGARRWQADYVVTAGRPVPVTAFRPAARRRCAVLTIRRRW
jgi:23S rRNA (adenine-N6)-dimethyltransferase